MEIKGEGWLEQKQRINMNRKFRLDGIALVYQH